jgi:hypothetical protein
MILSLRNQGSKNIFPQSRIRPKILQGKAKEEMRANYNMLKCRCFLH